ncbi:hypothetical protein, partial [Cardinium endosymbiont of Culicoides punctatus]|uniref:hypothetical protein n=1 Tax=Cardinium endosymbiont of Culicoides punctatus TaxID=2304601 RepID=UPI0019573790
MNVYAIICRIIRKISTMGYIIAFVSFPAYAEMHMMYDIQENALGFPSWTVYLHGHPGYKNYQIPNNIMQDGCHWGTWVTFPQKVEAIQAAVGRYTHPIELFRSKDFLVIHKHHGYYYEAILDYLVDSRYTLEQKKISIFALTQSYQLCEDAYRLYKTNKINEHLLDLIFSIKISNLIAQNHVGKPYENVLAALKKAGVYSFLIQVHKELDKTTRLYKELTELFNNIFPKTWHVYLINANTLCNQSYCDGNSELPYHAIIAYAVREKDAWDYYRLGTPIPVNIFPIPWFLVILEHPAFYYPFQFGPYSGLKNGVDILRDPEYSPEEKSMAILAMSQLDATNYAFIIENAC